MCIVFSMISRWCLEKWNVVWRKMAAMSATDPSSYSEIEKCEIRSLEWDVTIDFSTQTIGGFAHLTVENKVETLETLVLDIRDLTVETVTLRPTGQECQFAITNPLNVSFGSKLTINLGQIVEKSFTVSIKYVTSSKASALQWLRPEQTAGKRQPYLFSQCQAIHARSLLPCQDTPAVKFPYTARIQAPKEVTVLMSAVREGTEPAEHDSSQLVTKFSMAVPIPSYLIAIAAGDLESREIGPRSKVWSEKEVVDAAAFEFAETETMLQTAESVLGPYVWGIYDLLVMPPSFPYGGMENPCLTFVTPTLLAGDRSLADVIAHEISHSWTGNLVTNKSPEHFWLNEGHTMFCERIILSRMHGESHRQIHAYEGWKDLHAAVEALTQAGNEPYTKLVPDLKGVDPDDAFSAVPYEKGFALLYQLQNLLGGPTVFEAFLRAYIENFKYKSITTEDWKKFLFAYFSSEEDQAKLNSFDWKTWFHGLGMPPYQPNYDLSMAEPSRILARRWIQQPDNDLTVFSPDDINNIPSILIREFLSQIFLTEPSLSLAKVKHLEQVYGFNRVGNSEIRFKWLRLCAKVKWENSVTHALKFVNEQGRMKFVRPIYRDLYDWEYARPLAIANFNAHRSEMHNTAAALVAKDLKLED
uniref:Peptidase M1 leukotriene A4 hydrolase/aminopeptidase C-terminal domain-containing protein n=1 Tax=Arion vulgaris TaxID=1028688 RepID=A0A0B7A8X7_9EUPU